MRGHFGVGPEATQEATHLSFHSTMRDSIRWGGWRMAVFPSELETRSFGSVEAVIVGTVLCPCLC